MTLVCTPDLGIAMPEEELPYTTLRERAAAACKTIGVLVEHGLPAEAVTKTNVDEQVVQKILNSFAEDEDKTNKEVTSSQMSNMTPSTVIEINLLLTEFGQATVKNAIQIRHLVTNKLILETNNPDARVRLRALELLGKHSDVGLFTERSEVTVNHRSTDELKLSLREKLQRLKEKVIIEDVQVVETKQIKPPPIDIDAELGIDAAVK